jgi:hypothetical protein
MQYARNPEFVPAAWTCIVNGARGFGNAVVQALALTFSRAREGSRDLQFVTEPQPFGRIGVYRFPATCMIRKSGTGFLSEKIMLKQEVRAR